jgi:hypothetical protein
MPAKRRPTLATELACIRIVRRDDRVTISAFQTA